MDFFLHILIVILMTLPTALGYNLIFGKGKVLHFGQLAFSLVGIYPLWILVLRMSWSIPLALCVSMLAITALALLFTWLSLRLDPDGLGVISIAMHLAVLSVVLNWSSVTRGALGITNIPRFPGMETIEGFLLVTFVVVACWFGFLFWLDRGRFGRALAALAESQWCAASMGIDRKTIHFLTFLIAGTGALLSNFFYHSYLRILHPNDFNFPAMIFYIMLVSAGGPGSIRGITIATVLLIFLREGLRLVPQFLSTLLGISVIGIIGPLQLFLFGLILFVAVWYRRETMFPKQRTI